MLRRGPMTFSPRVQAPARVLLASFEIPRTVKSLNARVQNAGVARGIYKRTREQWAADLFLLRKVHKVAGAPIARRRFVTLTRLFSGREREFDYDNLVGGMKLVVDALVIAEWAAADSPKWIDVTYRQEPVSVSGLRVEVWE